MPALPSLASISRYYLITWLGVIAHVSRFTSREQYADPFTALWTLSVTASYSMFYLLPALALGYLCYWLLNRSKSRRSGNLLLATTLIALTGLTHVALFADRMIHDMYLFEVKSSKDSSTPWDYYKMIAKVPGEQAFTTVAESKCSLLKK